MAHSRPQARPKVVVIGAGFGGLEVARHLADAPVDVLLVDRHNFHTFQPLLYQVATSGLNAADVAHPVRGLFHRQDNVDFRRGEVEGVDWQERMLLVEGQDPIAFDHLVVAAGSSVTYFDVPGAAEHAFPLYTLEDAVRLRNHLLERFEDTAAAPALLDDGALTFVVVGGGPTGVETAGAMAELFAMVLRKDFPDLDLSRARIVLVELQDHLLAPFSPTSRAHALATLLERHGVEVRLGEQVAAVERDSVKLASGEVIPTQTLVWAAGVRANPVAAALGVDQGPGGRIVVGPDLQVPGRRGVWAIGDVAHIRHGDGGLPQLAPVALQSGRHVARQIRRVLTGEGTQPFHYRDKGTMATIGRRAAVAELPFGIKLSGSLAWLAWLGLHLVQLVGKRNRASVLVNWAWNYLTWDRGPRIILRADRVPDSVSDHG